jgi:hypothetical protein
MLSLFFVYAINKTMPYISSIYNKVMYELLFHRYVNKLYMLDYRPSSCEINLAKHY